MGDADLFLLTSDEEGTPNVVLEAMIAGVPVLGFNIGSMNSILAGELSPFLIEASNDAAMKAKLHECVEHRDSLSTWREKFHKRAFSDFSYESSMQRYLDVLQAVATPA